LTLLDIAFLLWPLAGVMLMLAVGRYGSRQLRAETARAREAAHKAQQQFPHATR
jgi:hypothetical protein